MDRSATSFGRCKNGWGKSTAFAERAYESDNNNNNYVCIWLESSNIHVAVDWDDVRELMLRAL